MKHPLTQAVVLIFVAFAAFSVPARGPQFDQFRPVNILALMGSGLCIGVALSLLLRPR